LAVSSTPATSDLLHEPDLVGPLGAHATAGVGELARDALRDAAPQPLQRADVGGHPDVDLLHHEESVGAGVAQVRGGGEVEGPADAAALDGDEHRHTCLLESRRGPLQRLDGAARAGLPAAELGVGVGLAAGEHRQVHAGAEVLAGAGDHDRPGGGLVADAGDDLGQLGPELGDHRVELVRSRQPHMGDVVGDLDVEAAPGLGYGVHPTILPHGWVRSVR
jgi:hypothetical protein